MRQTPPHCEPANNPGRSAHARETLSSSVPGVLEGSRLECPYVRPEGQRAVGRAHVCIKVSEPELLMNVVGAAKPVSDASSVTVSGMPSVFSKFVDESCNSLCAPNIDCASVSCTKAPPIVWSIQEDVRPPDTSHESWPSKQVNVEAPTPIESCSLPAPRPPSRPAQPLKQEIA